jgi:hypothetical protein
MMQMQPNPQQMFMQQTAMGNPMGMGPGGLPGPPPGSQMPPGPRMGFNQNIGPLAYLEKTTNNIDLGDQRR